MLGTLSNGEMLRTKYGMLTQVDVGAGAVKSLVLKDVGRDEIYQAMGLLARTADPEDSILVYYAGAARALNCRQLLFRRFG